MDGLKYLFFALGVIFILSITASVVEGLLRRYPDITKCILVLFALGYFATILVMCMNGILRGPSWEYEEEPYCPGPPFATC
jgi:hypothetical protein